jgi:ATP-dependent DNA ligase
VLRSQVRSKLGEPNRESPTFDASLADLVRSVKAQGLEGLVAKRLDSRYEAGTRSRAWQKMRVNQGQEFVIGGYTPSARNFDALIFGYYEGDKLLYAARTRNGFTPSSRASLFKQFRALEIGQCPFVNLPEARGGRWGEGLTVEKMKQCRWLKPVLVAQFEFLEWTRCCACAQNRGCPVALPYFACRAVRLYPRTASQGSDRKKAKPLRHFCCRNRHVPGGCATAPATPHQPCGRLR